MRSKPASLGLDASLFPPGLRVAVGLSGGADSVALLRALADRSRDLGIVLHIAHLHHGLRGAEADADRDFCRDLAKNLQLPFHEARVDTATAAQADAASGKAGETIEEAARRLRYHWFRDLLSQVPLDAIATAHTLDDQAETVLAKFLRGAWTEGLSGIHPVLRFSEGRILRPLLATTRTDIETYLGALGQPWREDSSNRHLTFTRNRIRYELLPLLEKWNPRLRERLAQMAELARDEDAWWEAETGRIAGPMILPGRAVRGGGRAAGQELAIEVTRLAELPVALQRRVLRHTAANFGAAPDFSATESLRRLALDGHAGQKCEVAGLQGERTHRELRLAPGGASVLPNAESAREYVIQVPGEVEAREWGIRVRVGLAGRGEHPSGAKTPSATPEPAGAPEIPNARLRPWKMGDRVRLRHSGAPRKVKEVLERLHITGSARTHWPVLALEGRIIWMQGVQLEPEPGIVVSVDPLGDSRPEPGPS